MDKVSNKVRDRVWGVSNKVSNKVWDKVWYEVREGITNG
jgi:hypothetical protein